ncbi:MAG: DUF4294 domain-containing protein [Bacteroidales bacterium]|nr:DUF4294 domain-containing protein [Bacteroidales bacterium]
MRNLLAILSLLPLCAALYSQGDTTRTRTDSVPGRVYLLNKVERNGEILPEVEIREVTVYATPKSERRSGRRYNERLIYNIKRVYPYALIVREKLTQVNYELSAIEGDRARKEYLRKVEKEVFEEYEDDLSKMTITQGKILIKLIDRETQNTSFELIREYRGKFPAAFWQGVARIFGTNLKAEYDPLGEDAEIERILSEIEAGRL